MRKNIVLKISALLAVGALSLAAANSPIIGMVSSGPGSAGVRIDGARVSANATVFDGALVSATAYSRLQLNSGTRVDLGADSAVKVFANHALLEGGSSEVQSNSGYTMDARSLKIQPTGADSIARVSLSGSDRVLVSALTAPVNVWNGSGVLVARVLPATTLSFLPQAGSATAFSNSGCVVNKSGAAVLVDQTGNQVFELRSTVKTVDLRKFVGKRAKVGGAVDSSAKAVAGATQVVNVSTIEGAEGASCSDVAARIGATTTAAGLAAGGAGAAGAAGAGAAAAGAGTAAGVSGAVIGGVAAATAVGVGTAVAVANSNSTS
jgi:hypothetical protein